MESSNLVQRLSRLSRLLRRQLLRELENHDTTPEQYFLLERLFSLGQASQVQLADPLLDDRPNITRQLKSLLDRGWVSRTVDAVDRRKRVVVLTPAGHQALTEMGPPVRAILQDTFGDVAPHDLDAIDRLLDTVEPVLA